MAMRILLRFLQPSVSPWRVSGGLVAFTVAGVFILDRLPHPHAMRHQLVTQHLIDELAKAAEAYEHEHKAYPPGDGRGSSSLVRALSIQGPTNLPYVDFGTIMVDAEGSVVSFIRSGDRLNYRCPGLHNPTSFDLWCPDTSGRPDGCNNWD